MLKFQPDCNTNYTGAMMRFDITKQPQNSQTWMQFSLFTSQQTNDNTDQLNYEKQQLHRHHKILSHPLPKERNYSSTFATHMTKFYIRDSSYERRASFINDSCAIISETISWFSYQCHLIGSGLVATHYTNVCNMYISSSL